MCLEYLKHGGADEGAGGGQRMTFFLHISVNIHALDKRGKCTKYEMSQSELAFMLNSCMDDLYGYFREPAAGPAHCPDRGVII